MDKYIYDNFTTDSSEFDYNFNIGMDWEDWEAYSVTVQEYVTWTEPGPMSTIERSTAKSYRVFVRKLIEVAPAIPKITAPFISEKMWKEYEAIARATQSEAN